MLETELLDGFAFLRTPMVKHEPELTAERLDEESHANCHRESPSGPRSETPAFWVPRSSTPATNWSVRLGSEPA